MPGIEGEPIQDFLQKKLDKAAEILKEDYDPDRITNIFAGKTEQEVDSLLRDIDTQLFGKPMAARGLTVRRWMMKEEEREKTRRERTL